MFDEPRILQAIARAARVIRRSVEIDHIAVAPNIQYVGCRIKGTKHVYAITIGEYGQLVATKHA